MDIIDIVLSRALTPQGQIESYAALAQRAVTNATNAVSTAQDAVTTVNSVAEAAQQTLTQLQNATQNIAQAAQDEIDKLAFELVTTTNSNAIENAIKVTYPSEDESTIVGITKYYKGTGNNQDGTMTQKAITEAIRTNSGNGGNGANFGPENQGHIVIVGQNGNITTSETITEQGIINALVGANNYIARKAAGLKVNYENYTYTRTQDAAGKTAGHDFDDFAMYGGRMRCLVNNNGQIVAFYGDNNYSENLNNGYQVMIYQPKFYYSRVPTLTESSSYGEMIREENIMISTVQQDGFSIHPLFINESGQIVDYVLLSAYEGSIEANSDKAYTDDTIPDFLNQKLASVAGARPISGFNNQLMLSNAQNLAKNRGTGWHITNMRFESAMQMLETIEFGTMNLQSAFQSGITEVSSIDSKGSVITGSTSNLGNVTGAASSTIYVVNGVQTAYTNPGYRAISYRGFENPWGNMWRIIGDVKIRGGSRQGGEVYICKNYNYDESNFDNYNSVGYYLPNGSGWISAFGYNNNSECKWAFVPIECSSYASNIYPVGDSIWIFSNLISTNGIASGGSWAYGSSAGPFYYACDKGRNNGLSRFNARLMYIPRKSDSFYNSNISAWYERYGG